MYVFAFMEKFTRCRCIVKLFECTPLQMNNSKKEKNSKTKIRFFFVKKMMKMKYIPLIHTLFNAVDSNLYCVFYENHTFTSLSELWCVYVRTIHMNKLV